MVLFNRMLRLGQTLSRMDMPLSIIIPSLMELLVPLIIREVDQVHQFQDKDTALLETIDPQLQTTLLAQQGRMPKYRQTMGDKPPWPPNLTQLYLLSTTLSRTCKISKTPTVAKVARSKDKTPPMETSASTITLRTLIKRERQLFPPETHS